MIWLLLLFVPMVHKLLLKITAYRWLVNTIIYPVNKLIIGRRFSKMAMDERIWNWTRFETMEHWSKDYWFSKAISKYILLKYIDKEGSR